MSCLRTLNYVYFAGMNFLGHFYLSDHEAGLVVGNFIADFVKGSRYKEYPADIARGIVMHREIDTYTDSHPAARISKKRLFAKYRHYSSVIVDLFYDHFLAKNWQNYSKTPLEEYSRQIYQLIELRWDILPPASRYMFPYMKNHDWLVRYAKPEGIDRSLKGLARRTLHPSRMEEAAGDLLAWEQQFEEEFTEFFPDIVKLFKAK
jgi:acyl carrier protein phosphodiesterase